MDNKNTEDKTLSDIRQVERHFIDPDLQLEGIQCQNFDEFYALEKRQQSKIISVFSAWIAQDFWRKISWDLLLFDSFVFITSPKNIPERAIINISDSWEADM